MKYINYLLYAICMNILFSCDLLDLSPEDYYGSSNFWNTEVQVNGYMLGIHNDFRKTTFNNYLMGEGRGNTLKTGTSFLQVGITYSTPIKNNTFTQYQTGITNWGDYYANILTVNLFIRQVEQACSFLEETDRNYLLGQAYGIRAFYYFQLYKTFGGVPIVKEPKIADGITNAEGLYTARGTAKETFNFIKEDIQKSETLFGENHTILKEKGMWSRPATLMLKAEVYLWSAKVKTGDQQPESQDIATAKSALLSILDGRFSLLPAFKDVFKYENKGNDEIIFAIRFADGEAYNKNTNYFLYRNDGFIGQFRGIDGNIITTDTLNIQDNGVHENEYKWELFAAMDDKDSRKRTTFLDCYGDEGNKGLILRKFTGTLSKTGIRIYCDDYIIYRYADALLMMAEVENMQNGDVATYINKVRQRAYGENYDPALHGYKNLSFEENELAILRERDMEFVNEGKRWYDLVRMQDANHESLVFSTKASYNDKAPTLKKDQAYMILWPIDIATINKDPLLKNNPGYEN